MRRLGAWEAQLGSSRTSKKSQCGQLDTEGVDTKQSETRTCHVSKEN